MSTYLVKKKIGDFLASSRDEVLCIKGRWGVGKTYAWKAAVEEASKKPEGIGLERYAYVSLFGVNSLDELKYAIFENTVQKSQVTSIVSIQTFKSLIDSLGIKKLGWALNFLPATRGLINAVSPGLFLTVRDQIICIDDLERKGQKLDAADVLGLISFLREERKCKVALLLNDMRLEDADKAKFDSYLEKVVDAAIVFAPSAAESAEAAIKGESTVDLKATENCIALGISNIRVIKKIYRTTKEVLPLIEGYNDEVKRQALASLPLLCWSHYQPDEAPTKSYLTERAKHLFGGKDPADISPKEAAWNALLGSYEFATMDDFDAALLEGIENGYFDPEKIKKLGKTLHDQATAKASDHSFEQAWRAYHDSFDDDQDQVLDDLRASFMTNFQFITPINLNGTVRLFKDVGRSDQAMEMLHHYMEHKVGDRTFFDLEEHPFANDITDPDVIAAFNKKRDSFTDDRDVTALLSAIRNGQGTERDVLSLASIPADMYRKAFKNHKGKELRQLIDAALQFNRLSNPTPAMKEITRRALEALKMIGEESKINARRVQKYGIAVERHR